MFGQLAGAFYGAEGIPPEWAQRVAMSDLILAFADKLQEFGATAVPMAPSAPRSA